MTLFNRPQMRKFTIGFCASLSCFVLPELAAAEDKPAAEPAAEHAATGAAAGAIEAGADYVCEAQVSFTWKRRPPPPLPNARPSKEEAPAIEPTTDFYTTIGEQGIVEADTKSRVAIKLATAQAEALNECRKRHESQAGCVTDKLRKTATDYARLDFAGRKTILDSVNADCTFNLGTCLSASASEIQCRTNRPPDVAPAAPATPAAAGAAEPKAAEGKDPKKKK